MEAGCYRAADVRCSALQLRGAKHYSGMRNPDRFTATRSEVQDLARCQDARHNAEQLSKLTMQRGPKPKCLCGECFTCKRRVYMQYYRHHGPKRVRAVKDIEGWLQRAREYSEKGPPPAEKRASA